ncbi:MAG: oxidoreductase [Planctomycetota bacterium]|jgi:NAD(P)-dependent dehydrogenase (short-subunit alcohol dehydrogenase family)
MSKTWFITGCSTGLGRALCEQLLEAGEQVVATARNVDDVADLAGERCLTAPLDVTVPAQIEAAVAAATSRFGRIDVLVNNAGYGEMGPVEEFSDERARRQFDVNVFGVLNVQRDVLPVMRAHGGGHVLNISSIAGLAAFPMAGMYCATKHALEAISEALAQEVAEFGIRVTLIEPGRFRTDFAGRSMGLPDASGPAYNDATAGYDERRQELHGTQPGDPVKAARAMMAVVASDDPPLRLLLGPDAWEWAEQKLAAVRKDLDAWKDTTLGTDFDA